MAKVKRCCEVAWAVWHPVHERPMVAHDSRHDVRPWGVMSTKEEAERVAKATHRDSRARRVLIVDPKFFTVTPKPKPARVKGGRG